MDATIFHTPPKTNNFLNLCVHVYLVCLVGRILRGAINASVDY